VSARSKKRWRFHSASLAWEGAAGLAPSGWSPPIAGRRPQRAGSNSSVLLTGATPLLAAADLSPAGPGPPGMPWKRRGAASLLVQLAAGGHSRPIKASSALRRHLTALPSVGEPRLVKAAPPWPGPACQGSKTHTRCWPGNWLATIGEGRTRTLRRPLRGIRLSRRGGKMTAEGARNRARSIPTMA